jgi:hypothetical protein
MNTIENPNHSLKTEIQKGILDTILSPKNFTNLFSLLDLTNYSRLGLTGSSRLTRYLSELSEDVNVEVLSNQDELLLGGRTSDTFTKAGNAAFLDVGIPDSLVVSSSASSGTAYSLNLTPAQLKNLKNLWETNNAAVTTPIREIDRIKSIGEATLRETNQPNWRIQEIEDIHNNQSSRASIAVVRRRDSGSSTGSSYPVLDPWLDNDPNTPSDLPSSLSANIVGSNRALVLSPFKPEFNPYDESDEIADSLTQLGFDVELKSDTQVTLNDFKQLDQYGVIAFISHGGRVEQQSGTQIPNSILNGSLNPDGSNSDAAVGRVALLTGISATLADFESGGTYYDDLVDGYVAPLSINRQIYVSITPSFITHYSSTLPNSLIYVGACDSTYNDTLADAFLNQGAGAFVGYSRVVDSWFADRHGQAMFNALAADRTTGEIPGIDVSIDPLNNALFDLTSASDTDLTINIGLRNGSFEIDNLSGWQTAGDASAIPDLGPLSAPEGEEMAFISTAESNSSISQSFFVPHNADTLTFEYNVISEEPSEYVGSQYDDQFDVLLNPAPTNSDPKPQSITVAIETINTSTWLPISGINFPGGDDTVFETGWQSVSFDLTPYQGREVELLFRTFDQGDAIYDTAALIDNMLITTI